MYRSTDKLLEIMAALRDPEDGCPWDLQQDFKSIIPYTLEETYEVVEAIESGDFDHIREELGDLLFQVVFYARMAEEEGQFDFGDVVNGIAEKLVRRHPHVFARQEGKGRKDGEQGEGDISAEEVSLKWDQIKKAEKMARGEQPDDSALAGVPLALPALQRAQQLQKKAAKKGFDWDAIRPVLDKLAEEIDELREVLGNERVLENTDDVEASEQAAIEEELGDILFSCVNVARHLGVDAEQVARNANRKFERRFRAVEEQARNESRKLEDMSLKEMDALWDAVKDKEKDQDQDQDQDQEKAKENESGKK